ncbi:PTS IIA-like nitrogen regulatory protein PtsN [Spartinivicinus poritis]|uniref:PTS IIA-like nitrogen regulatory protein PtsN n=1 Tax=Spartinivicinus poritis TaxID=2994640 RepID=A0ABT5U2N8_9GAMM|nr:PTS IIA-like nitrogen regulatory protein PtsN [Spartinivicinus sp. A2-2]MDE1460626.1 PTS IIA-like nitrogen regulatory protein PtsN [Spartinivicinus sp. A2-2]
MKIEQFLLPQCTLTGVQGGSKKRVLQLIANLLAEYSSDIDANELFDNLINRERLGSTGFGNGIAIPHCRLESCHKPFACLLKLEEGIDFDAIDGHPVDVIFALVVPAEATNEHLAILQELATRFENSSYRNNLRQADTNPDLFDVAIQSVPTA